MPGGTDRMLVALVDVDRPLPELSAGPDPYPAAWVIAMRGGRPVGHVEIGFTDGRISPDELGTRLAELPGVAAPADDPPAVPDSALPRVTVVVPTTFDRGEWLEQCVACLAAQDYPHFDVVVVDNRPDGTPERAERWARLCAYDARVSVVAEPFAGSSAARNAGVRAATGEVIAFADDDVLIHSGWLRAIGTCFAADPGLGGLTGAILPKELETPAQIWFERSGSTYDQHYDAVTFSGDGSWRGRFLGGVRPRRFQLLVRRPHEVEERLFLYRAGKLGASGSMAVRAAVLRELGGFDELLGAGAPVPGGEDLLLLVRLVFAGYRLRLEPRAYVRHTHWRTPEEFLGKIRSYGIGYTAMLCALVRTDRRHILGLGWYGLQAVALLFRKFASRGRPAAADYPPEFSRAELRGLLAGPWTYVTALRRAHRRPATEPARTPEEALR
jgi:GT2 family glycosyltransferase